MNNSAIVLVVDRLGTACLGPYGNTWVETPAFNRLAARSLLFENATVDSPQLDLAYRSFFSGRHGLEDCSDEQRSELLQRLSGAGVCTALISDERSLEELPTVDLFGEELFLEIDLPTTTAGEIGETTMARLFAEAMEMLDRQQPPFLLWIHARGLAAPWDAPMELRHALAAEDDPDPLQTVEVPSAVLTKDFDPDELLVITQAYAAQTMVLDACLGVLLDAIDHHPAKDHLLTVVTSPRGFPLGEHHIVGGHRDGLYGELLHVPCLFMRGDGQGALARSHALVQTPDIAATLTNWFGLEQDTKPRFASSLLQNGTIAASPQLNLRDRVMSGLPHERAIRTPAWFLRMPAADESLEAEGGECELYRKPDDRWEVNELSRRCPHIVEQLLAASDEYERALQQGTLAGLTPLGEELMEGIE